MTVEEEVRHYQPQIDELGRKVGVLSLRVYEPVDERGRVDPIFVVDLDTSRLNGYTDRYFEMMFGLQRIFAHPVDIWEQHMFDREMNPADVRLVPLELKNAA